MNSKKLTNQNIFNFDIQLSKYSDVSQIIDLIKGFEYPFEKEHYEWKYLNCPWDSVSIIHKNEADIIGHNGCIIRPFLIKNEQIFFGLNADGIVHKEYRRIGAFCNIEQFTIQQAAEKGVRYAYGFPNKFSFPFSLKVGYEIIGYMPVYIKILNMNKVLKRLFNVRILSLLFSKPVSLFFYSKSLAIPKNMQVKEVTSYPDSLDLLWYKVLADPERQFQNIGLRTKKFLEWRFNSCPDRKYKFIVAYNDGGEIKGYIVLRETDMEGLKEGIIVDIFHLPFDKETSTALIDYAYNYFIKANVDVIACLLSDTVTCIPETLRNFGFRKFIKSFNPRPWPVVLKHTALDKNDPSLLHEKQWYITWADCDVF